RLGKGDQTENPVFISLFSVLAEGLKPKGGLVPLGLRSPACSSACVVRFTARVISPLDARQGLHRQARPICLACLHRRVRPEDLGSKCPRRAPPSVGRGGRVRPPRAPQPAAVLS